MQRLHRDSGASRAHLRSFLEDGVGAKRARHRHDHEPGGKRKGKTTLPDIFD